MRVKITTLGFDGYRHTITTTLKDMRGGIYTEAALSRIRKTILTGAVFRHTQAHFDAVFEVSAA